MTDPALLFALGIVLATALGCLVRLVAVQRSEIERLTIALFDARQPRLPDPLGDGYEPARAQTSPYDLD